jgi:hypothetical protein
MKGGSRRGEAVEKSPQSGGFSSWTRRGPRAMRRDCAASGPRVHSCIDDLSGRLTGRRAYASCSSIAGACRRLTTRLLSWQRLSHRGGVSGDAARPGVARHGTQRPRHLARHRVGETGLPRGRFRGGHPRSDRGAVHDRPAASGPRLKTETDADVRSWARAGAGWHIPCCPRLTGARAFVRLPTESPEGA